MSVSSSSSSCGTLRSSSRSTFTWWANNSRALCTDSHSPIAIESAPASIPARPAIRTACPPCDAPATPMEMLRLETRPSFAPSTAARSWFPPLPRWRPSIRAIVPPSMPRPLASSRKRRAWDRSSPGIRSRASGWSSYIASSEASRSAMVGTTRLVPKWAAMNMRTRARHAGAIRLVSTPVVSSRSRQTPAWIDSTSTIRR